jgi:HPt (histidine-containing phosphotransfer) domain-containing protein
MTDENIIDPTALQAMLEMVGGDTAFLAEMIDTYLADSPQLLADLGQAVDGGNAELLRRAAHSLKSNSAGFGAHALAALARQLEDLGKQGSTAGAAPLLAAAGAEYERVQAALLAARPEG